jgi:asparagine synthase (glutamine-hydrolysing)
MCGILGFFAVPHRQDMAEIARKMLNSISHRGPDDTGTLVDGASGLTLGHRRLAILDLTMAGHQPMHSVSGRLVIVFNGELYNHLELRAQLYGAGVVQGWRGHSDTETLLAAIEHWGIEATLQRCLGMFAIALWDRETRVLTLARDRLGEKPLYYGWVRNGSDRAFVFGSELKALKAYPGFENPVCREALAQYLSSVYIPAPRSIYQGIYKLEPGCLLTVHERPPIDAPLAPLMPGQVHGGVALSRWWSLANVAEKFDRKQLTSETEVLSLLERQLVESVRSQSLSDVPLGAFLSGGVDSSTTVALMQSQSSRPVKTFTLGFDETGFDESPHALAVARHLRTDHHEMHVSAQMARDAIPTLPWMYDEPFADSSQIPMHLVCKAAKQHVTVALSGDGGDELFGGYNRYFWGPKIWDRLAWMPFPLRKALGDAIKGIPMSGWDRLSGFAGVSRLGDKAHKLANRLRSVRDMDGLYWSLVTEWQDPALVVRGLDKVPMSPWASDDALPSRLDPVERMMFRDTMTYLPDDILCKVDRAAMACSLETRVPFLDHRVVELAWRLPLNMKIRGNTGKWALRQVLYKYVPKKLIERPKAGFAIPIGQWLRGPLRDWAESLLGESRLFQEGYFHPEPIRKVWAEHLTGTHDHTSKIWTILMFQAWLEEEKKRR